MDRHSGAPRSGEPGIHEHKFLEYGFRVRGIQPCPGMTSFFCTAALGGREGWGEVGDSRALAAAHLTLPRLRRGSLPLPPEGRRGNFGLAP
jgi:hypothetical protein